ncbi:MAG: cell division protein FtsA [Anaerotruncus sp.]|nr:cell division protein FtsA [Anaerotruncus sp.]
MDTTSGQQDQKLIFALDIGTRSVIGVVGTVENGMLKVLRVESEEHTERAVVDGQIEDIEQTARIAGRIKERLETNLGFSLKEVYVAAAGRVLKTHRAVYSIDIDEKKPIDQRQLFLLESKAIQQAYEELARESEDESILSYYCVGHSVIRYTLDGYSFSTLLNHRGRKAQVELIGTFLPSEVVESLYATMSRIGLSIMSVTLEPIAAINAVIPQELRLLNVALVDVGAGTSDIAIANNGSVCAYTMATVAGDEVTERIMREFLVDFQMAEQMKRMLSEGKQTIAYTDILGLEYSAPAAEMLEQVLPTVEDLASTISQRVLEANGAPPMAVFMVGGGSRTPELCRLVAQGLSIDEKKVAIGGNNYMKRMVDTDPQYISAEYATPIGIAISAMSVQGQENLAVMVNGKRVRMMNGSSMSLMEALLRSGYQYGQIMGRSGKGVAFELNGATKLIRGGIPTLARFEVNGRPANITTPLQSGDEVTFIPAENGADAMPLLCDAVGGWNVLEVELNGASKFAGTAGMLNGVPAGGDEPVSQGDHVEVWEIATLEDLFESEQLMPGPGQVYVNGALCDDFSYRLVQGDVINILERPNPPEPKPPEVKPPELQQPVQPRQEQPAPSQAATPVVRPVQLETEQKSPQPAAQPLTAPQRPLVRPIYHAAQQPHEQQARPVMATASSAFSDASQRYAYGPVRVVLNGMPCILPAKADGQYVQFFDALNYVDIDPTKPQGEIVVLRNGRPASYVEPVLEGDKLDIYWKSDISTEGV